MSSQRDLAAELTALGFPTTTRTLEEWRSKGLLPKLERVGLGRGLGTENRIADHEGTRAQVIAIHRLRRRGCQGERLFLSLFFLGFPVEPKTAHWLWSKYLDSISVRMSRMSAKYSEGVPGFIGRWAVHFARKFEVPGFDQRKREALALEIGSLIFDADYKFESDANSDLFVSAYLVGFKFFGIKPPNEFPTEVELETLFQFLQNAFSLKSLTYLTANSSEGEFADAYAKWMHATRLIKPLLDNPNGLSRYLPKQRGEPLIAIGPLGIGGLLYLVKFDPSGLASKVIRAAENFLSRLQAEPATAIPALAAELADAHNAFKSGAFLRKVAEFQGKLG